LVTVHSLGAVGTPGGTLRVEDGAGRLVATAPVPAMAAPLDLMPKTVEVRVSLPAGARAASVVVGLPGDAPEVTRLNNVVMLP
jgi:hypothetical protein